MSIESRLTGKAVDLAGRSGHGPLGPRPIVGWIDSSAQVIEQTGGRVMAVRRWIDRHPGWIVGDVLAAAVAGGMATAHHDVERMTSTATCVPVGERTVGFAPSSTPESVAGLISGDTAFGEPCYDAAVSLAALALGGKQEQDGMIRWVLPAALQVETVTK